MRADLQDEIVVTEGESDLGLICAADSQAVIAHPAVQLLVRAADPLAKLRT